MVIRALDLDVPQSHNRRILNGADMSEFNLTARQIEQRYEEEAADRLVTSCTSIVQRLARSSLYGIGAYALSFTIPAEFPTTGLPAAVLLLSLPRRSIYLAEIILVWMVIISLLPAAALRYLGF